MVRRANGAFGYQLVGGFVDYEPGVYFEPLLGIPPSMQYVYGSFRSASGSYFWPIRGLYADRTRHLHIAESKSGGDFEYAPEGEAAYDGPVAKSGGAHAGARSPDGSSYVLEAEGSGLRWSEGDVVDVEGRAVGTASQFHAPDADCPLIYTSQLFRTTSARIKGEEVEGLFFFDALHLPEGADWITSPYYAALQAAWVAFATELDDGTIHAGHLVHGLDGFNILLTQSTDGSERVSRHFDVAVALDGDPAFPAEVRYTTRDRDDVWVWSALETGRMPVREDLVPGHRWRQGVVRLEGDTRDVVRSEALMETYNLRLSPEVLRG